MFPFCPVGDIRNLNPGGFQFVANLVGESKILRFLRIAACIDFGFYLSIGSAVFRDDGEFTGSNGLLFQLLPFCCCFFQQAVASFVLAFSTS